MPINGNGMIFFINEKGVQNIESVDCKISTQMTGLPRHQGYLREDDGSMAWRRLLPLFYRDHPDAPKWKKQMWIDHLQRGSDKKRFQYCLGPNGFILCMRDCNSIIQSGLIAGRDTKEGRKTV